jgi:hypothetical protein
MIVTVARFISSLYSGSPLHEIAIVIAGLDPAIHLFRKYKMDARVKPAHDLGDETCESKPMAGYDVHLVGSIPLRNATEVFEAVAATLGERVLRIPDGETGERSHWLGWLESIFSGHPAFEKSGHFSRPHVGGDARPLYRLKDAEREPTFDNLPVADVAIASYGEFRQLKDRGTIPRQVRFQVSVANPISLVERFVTEDSQERVLPSYERALLRDIERISAVIPHDQLAIQWDIASRVMASLEIGEPTRFGRTRTEMLANFASMAVRWGDAVPPGVELLFHLCYGDNAHKHVVEPESLAMAVDLANAISAGIGRPIELIHMPVPRGRGDDDYFAPLKRLAVRPETRVSLGLVHHTDGVKGTRRRIMMAEKFLPHFLIATECGFGRRPPETIPGLLAIHAEVAGIRSFAEP